MFITIIRTIFYYPFEFIFTFFICSSIIIFSFFHFDKAARAIFRFWGKVLFTATGSKLEFIGLEKLNKNECYIFCPNHSSSFDIYLISGYLPYNFCWISKDTYLKIPILGRAMRALNFIGMERKNPKKSFAGLKKSVKIVNEKKLSIVIFPEGTRSLDGKLQPFKRGSLYIAIESGLKIVPTTLIGVYDILPKKKFLVQKSKVKIIENNYYNKIKKICQYLIKKYIDCFIKLYIIILNYLKNH